MDDNTLAPELDDTTFDYKEQETRDKITRNSPPAERVAFLERLQSTPVAPDDVAEALELNPPRTEIPELIAIRPEAPPTPDDVRQMTSRFDFSKYHQYTESEYETRVLSLMKSHDYTREQANEAITLGTAKPAFSETFEAGFNSIPEPIRGYSPVWSGGYQTGDFIGSTLNYIIPAWNGVMDTVKGTAITAREYISQGGGALADSYVVDKVLGLHDVMQNFTDSLAAAPAALAEGAQQDTIENSLLGVQVDLTTMSENRPITAAISRGAGNLAATVGAFLVGGPAAGFATNYGIETGLAYEEAQKRGVGTPGQQLLLASGQGAVAASLELLPLHLIGSAVANRATRGFVRQAVANLGVAASEGTTEGLTSFGQAALEGVYNYSLGVTSGFLQSVKDEVFSPETIMDAKLSAIAGFALGGGASVIASTNYAAFDKNRRDALSDKFVAVKQALEGSQMPDNLRKDFLSTVSQTLSNGDGSDNIFVSYRDFRTLFQSDKDAQDALVGLGVTPEDVLQAKDAGVNLRLGLADVLNNLSEEQVAAIPQVMDTNPYGISATLKAEEARAKNTIASFFGLRETDPVLNGSVEVTEVYGRIENFAQTAMGAWTALQAKAPAIQTQTTKLAEFRNIGLLLESRAAVLEDTFGIPRQDTWDRWNIDVRGMQDTQSGLQDVGDVVEGAPPTLGRRSRADVLKDLISRATRTEGGKPRRGVLLSGLDSSGKPANIIGLFKNSDRTTLLHEMSHVFFNDMLDLADTYGDSAPARFKEDVQTLKSALGIADGTEITTAQQEQFAKAWEAYFFEGRNPAVKGTALHRVFNTFSQYLKSVYKSILRLGGQVSPEIKEVFDRMLSTEGQLSEVVNRRSYAEEITLLYELQKAGALDISALDELSLFSSEVIADAEARLDRQKMKDFKRYMADARRWAGEQYNNDPTISMFQFFTQKDAAGRSGLGKAWVLEAFGDDGYKQIAKARGSGFVRENGKIPMEYYSRKGTPEFDFDSFYTLLTQTPTKKNYLKAKIDEYGVINDSGLSAEESRSVDQERLDEQIQIAFAQAIKNLFGTNLTPKPLNVLRRQAEQGGAARTEAKIKERQDKITGATIQIGSSIKALVNVAKSFIYVNNMPVDSPEASAKKEALTEQLNAQVSELGKVLGLPSSDLSFTKTLTDIFHLREELRAQRVEMRQANLQRGLLDRATKTMNTAYKRAVKGGFYAPDYNSAIKSIVAILNPSLTASLPAHGEALRDFITANNQRVMEGLDLPVMISEQTIAALQKATPGKALSFGERMQIFQDLESVAAAGRSVYKLGKAAKALSIDEAADRIADEIMANTALRASPGLVDPRTGVVRSRQERAEKKNLTTALIFNRYTLAASRAEFVLSNLANAQTLAEIQDSALYQLFVQPANRMFNAEIELSGPLIAEWDNIMSYYASPKMGEYFYGTVTLSNGMKLTRQELFSMMLNTGTESNLDALLGPPDSTRPVSIPRALLWEAKSKLSKADWDNIAAIWKLTGSLGKPLQDKVRQFSGRELPLVEGITVDTPYGEYQGGYFPLVADQEVQQFKNVDKEDNFTGVASMLPQMFKSAYPSTFAVKERMGGVWAVSTDINILPRHIKEVSTWITHIEGVRDMNNLLNHDTVRDAINRAAGRDTYRYLQDWVRKIANPTEITPYGIIGRAVRWVRVRTPYQFIGFSLKTVATIGTGNILVSMADISPKYIGSATQQAFKDVRKITASLLTGKSQDTMFSTMLEKSAMTRELFENPDRLKIEYLQDVGRNTFENLGKQQQDGVAKILGVPAKALSKAGLITEALARKSWQIMSTVGCFQMGIIWNAAYHQALDRHAHLDAAERETAAVEEADLAFRRSNPAFAQKDLVPLQTGSEFERIFSTLGSDKMTMMNIFLTSVLATANKQYGRALVTLLPLMLTAAWMELLQQLFSKKELSLSGILVHGALGPVINDFYGISDVAFAAENIMSQGTTRWASGLPLPPAMRVLDNMFSVPYESLAWLSADSSAKEKEAIRNLEYALWEPLGAILNLPGGAIKKLYHGLQHLWDGDTVNPLAIFGMYPAKEK